ncbi:MAG: family 43 glycosylhydrolase [Bacteroidales bacterium]
MQTMISIYKALREMGLMAALILLASSQCNAQNPIITDQFTADPSARVFNGRVYVYPSHDILANESRGRIGWFCMEDYHVFSSSNLTDWTDHGVIVHQEKVPWVNPDSYSMWAPDCIAKNGKYYFYFPSIRKDTTSGRGFGIGVAKADRPEGPYTPESDPIKGVNGIDPNVFIDQDGQAYLYWSLGNLFVARLKENMLELDSEPLVIEDLPREGLKEGPFMFERNGIYYLTYPHVENKTERLEYAIGKNPLGPFTVTGVIMDESPTGCWTNHQSIMEYQGQWYLFYHHNDLSPSFDKARSIRIDSLFFNEDGTIQKVTPTLRGVGVTSASDRIQIDRFSARSDTMVQVAFLDTLDTFKGWKAVFGHKNAWVRYNSVDFGDKAYSYFRMIAVSPDGGKLELRLDLPDGPLIAETEIPAGPEWLAVEENLSAFYPGIHHLVVVSKEDQTVAIDWIQFK